MSTGLVPIDEKNFQRGEITFSQAVEIAYSEELSWIEEMLRAGLSVLIFSEKALSLQLYAKIRNILKSSDPPLPCFLIDAAPSEDGGPFFQQMVADLWKKVRHQLAEPEGVVVIPHLDLLTTTTSSNLGNLARETIAALSQDPSLRFLAFCDPGLQLPQPIADLFDVHRTILGLKRSVLPRLLTYEEAQRFGVNELNVYRLYKFVSGINAIKFRKIMARILEFPPLFSIPPEEREAQLEKLERLLREMTLLGGMEIPRVDLDRDIGGYEDIKTRIKEDILDILKLREDPAWADKIDELEALLPRGILFYGPPGTGKTYLAKALATAIQATTIVISGPEIKSKWVGESEANLRRLFAQAREAAPAMIIFDEIDAIAPQRGLYGGSGVEHSLVNQLLTEMDGFRKEELVFVVGTTNFIDSVDPALLRPGRFEYQLYVPYPNRAARAEIIDIYAKKFKLDIPSDVRDYLVKRTDGYADPDKNIRFSGDHLYGIIRQLKRLQLRKKIYTDPFSVSERDIDEILGPLPPMESDQMSKKRRFKAAFHEAGHALVASILLGIESVYRVSIESEHSNIDGSVSVRNYFAEAPTREIILQLIQVALAGREAELLIGEDVDIGSKNDLDFATKLAYRMVEEFGMSYRLGPRVFTFADGQTVPKSQKIQEEIDEEVSEILHESQRDVRAILSENAVLLEKIAIRLLEKGVIDNRVLKEILQRR